MRRAAYLSMAMVVACGGGAVATVPAAPSAPSAPSARASAAPPADASAPAPPLPPAIAAQRSTLLAMSAALNAHDPQRVASAYAAGCVVGSAGADGWKEQHGPEEIAKEHASVFERFPDLAFRFVRVFQKGDVAVGEWVVLAHDAKDKRPVGWRAASVFWFDAAGRVAKEHVYFDQLTLAVQLGRAQGAARALPKLPNAEPRWIVARGDAAEAALDEEARRGWPALWTKKDRAGFAATLADDVVREDVASPVDYVGKAANLAEYDALAAAMPDLVVAIDQQWTVDDFVLVEFVFSGTQTGDLGPVKATGKKVSVHSLDVDEYAAKKLVHAASYSNSIEFLSQLGALSPK